MLKAIFFDAGGTLIHLPRPVGEHYREVAARHGATLDGAALDRAFRAAFAAAPPRVPSNGARPDDDKGWWRDLVGRILAEGLPVAPAGFDQALFFEDLYAHFAAPGVWAAFPEVAEVLRELRRRGLAVGVISNFDRRLYAVLGTLGLAEYFQAVVISSEVGVEKPHPRIFQRALDALGVAPAEALHIGDEPSDWAAEALGLRVVRLERPRMDLCDAMTAIEEGLQPGAS